MGGSRRSGEGCEGVGRARAPLRAILAVCSALLLLMSVTPVRAGGVSLKPGHPERYTVRKGDTLWGIAGRFLSKPWQWPLIWRANPAIKNPNLIYPGDLLVLSGTHGRQRLSIERRGGSSLPEVVLRPQVRAEPLPAQAIPTIPLGNIQAFLSRPLVVSAAQLREAPRIVSVGKGHLVAGSGHLVYAVGLGAHPVARYAVYRRGQEYFGQNGTPLGYAAVHVGDARLVAPGGAGRAATLELFNARQEVLVGDRLLPAADEGVQASFQPTYPSRPVEGRIIAVLGGLSLIGQYQTVVIDRGERAGLRPGSLLSVYERGSEVADPAAPSGAVDLPPRYAGVAMVIRPFQRLSYALIMEAARTMHVGDEVRNPVP